MKQKLLESTFKLYHYIMVESLNKIKNNNEKERTKGGIVSKIIEWPDFPAYHTQPLAKREGKGNQLLEINYCVTHKEKQKAAFQNNISN